MFFIFFLIIYLALFDVFCDGSLLILLRLRDLIFAMELFLILLFFLHNFLFFLRFLLNNFKIFFLFFIYIRFCLHLSLGNLKFYCLFLFLLVKLVVPHISILFFLIDSRLSMNSFLKLIASFVEASLMRVEGVLLIIDWLHIVLSNEIAKGSFFQVFLQLQRGFLNFYEVFKKVIN